MSCYRGLPISERIESHIISKENCWLTDLACNSLGYPPIRINGKTKRLNRVIYELHKGEIPPGKFVCHKCDNPACINPNHLFLGTPQENMDDKVTKNRQSRSKGSLHGLAKLDEEKVLEIKRLLAETNLTQKEIAKKYGVCHQTISYIKNGKLWGHVRYEPNNINNITNNHYHAKNITINNYSESKQLSLFDE
jgi:DNA-binding XRE family transcriptional regulator